MNRKNYNIKTSIFISYIILFFLHYSCSNQRNVEVERIQFIPKENIQMLLDSFVKENKNENYVYELYIDKMSPHECNLILYSGMKSLTELENEDYKQKPLAFTMVSGIKIDIYSGMERYFVSSIQKDALHSDNKYITNNTNYDEIFMWAVIDSFGVLRTRKLDFGYPFIPFSTINFIPPPIDK